MQGTIRTFDPNSQSGDLLLDDGSMLTFGPTAFAASGLRLLRLGQRVRIETGPDGSVARLTIATLPFRN
jgi:2-phospho-L-lactate guanylyltransferase